MADTIPGDPTTTATITIGGNANGAIDTVGDHDWFKITLTAGQTITITLNGTTLDDPYLRVWDSSGNVLVKENDDYGGLNSQLSFQVTQSGTYYIDVAAWADPFDPTDPYPGSTGDYQLTVSAFQTPPVYTNDQIATQLVSGYWGDGAHSFVLDPTKTLTVDITGLTAAGQILARQALQTWSEITGITFNEVSSTPLNPADIEFTDDDPDGGAFTESTYSGNNIATSHVNVDVSWLSQYGFTVGGYAYQAYLHEIGHALGLGHAGNYNTIAEYPFDALNQNDAWSTSVMSYFSQTENTYFADQGFTHAYVVTPMVADILAVQQLYGLSTTTRSGNTTYGFNSNAGVPYDLSHVAYTIFDTGGVDTLDYSGYSNSQRIDLTAEHFSNIGGEVGNVTIARGTVIENAIGGSGSDTILGNAAANVLRGNGGVDNLYGLDGNDTLSGGSGNDSAYGGLGDDIIRVDQAGDKVVEAAGEGFDTVKATVSYVLQSGTEIEQLRAYDTSGTIALNLTGNELGQKIVGNAGKNILIGNGGIDKLYGLGGNDTLSGGTGNDFLYGGLGNDTYRVDQAGDRVIEAGGEGIDIVKATVSFTLGAGSEIEQLRAYDTSGTTALNLFGNEFGQTILGNAGANVLRGFGGSDSLSGGAGNDTLYGGTGDDIIRVDQAGDRAIEATGEGYDTVKATVSFNLEAGSEIEELRAYDTAGTTSLNLSGNEFGQTIVGNAAANVLRGFAGNDTLSGGGGNDTLYGGLGDDTYRVDQVDDRVIEAVGEGYDVVKSTVSFAIKAGSEVEQLRVYDATTTTTVNLYGNEFGQKIVGNDGTNLLRGFAGDDQLFGQGGNDQLDAGTGNNVLTGGAGVDRFIFSDLGVNDRITDFASGERIDLRGMDADSTLTGDQAFNWIGGNVFSHTAGEVRTYMLNGVNYLAGDVNGDGIADFVIDVGTHQVVSGDLLF